MDSRYDHVKGDSHVLVLQHLECSGRSGEEFQLSAFLSLLDPRAYHRGGQSFLFCSTRQQCPLLGFMASKPATTSTLLMFGQG
jgi:hypothetical protein